MLGHIFGEEFLDINNDGEIDSFEKTIGFGFFFQMMDSEKNDELSSAGLNPFDLEDMGYFERREAIEDAGLNPEDYE